MGKKQSSDNGSNSNGGGKNKGGNGGGTAKLLPASEHDRRRREAKARQRRGAAADSGRFHAGGDILAEVRDDRAQARQLVRLHRIQHTLEVATGHLRRHGTKQVPGAKQGTTRQRWSETTLELALNLLRAYFLGDEEAIATAEAALQPGIIRETQRRFSTTCVTEKTRGVPGQSQEWYEKAAAEGEAFLATRAQKPTAAQAS
jgi:hypothetical protein